MERIRYAGRAGSPTNVEKLQNELRHLTQNSVDLIFAASKKHKARDDSGQGSPASLCLRR